MKCQVYMGSILHVLEKPGDFPNTREGGEHHEQPATSVTSSDKYLLVNQHNY